MIQGVPTLTHRESRRRPLRGGAARALKEEVPSTTEAAKAVADTAENLPAGTARSAVDGDDFPPPRPYRDRGPINFDEPPTYASGSD